MSISSLLNAVDGATVLIDLVARGLLELLLLLRGRDRLFALVLLVALHLVLLALDV